MNILKILYLLVCIAGLTLSALVIRNDPENHSKLATIVFAVTLAGLCIVG